LTGLQSIHQHLLSEKPSSLLNHLPHQSGSYLVGCQHFHGRGHPCPGDCSRINL